MPYPVLTRFDTIVYKDKAGAAPLQELAGGVDIEFYRQGATASEVKTIGIGAQVSLNVYDTGATMKDEYVFVGVGPDELKVMAISSPTQLEVKNEGATTVSISVGTRLVPQGKRPPEPGDRPIVHPFDPVGISPASGSSKLTTGALLSNLGAAGGYISAPRVDYIVNLPTKQLYTDLEGGIRPSPSWVSVRDFPMVNACDFPSLQRAIDSLPPEGGEVFLPAGIYETNRGIVIDKNNVTLRGAGPLATIVRATRNPDFPLLSINRFACRLYDIQFDGNADVAGNNDLHSCIVMNGYSVSGNSVGNCLFENLRVCNGRFHGLLMQNIITFLAINCEFEGNRVAGVFLRDSGTSSRFLACRFRLNGTSGLGINRCQITLIGCDFEDNLLLSEFVGNAIDIVECERGEILGCRFLWTSNLGSPFQFIRGEKAFSLLVDGSSFMGAGAALDKRVKWGARLVNSSWARFTNNVGIDLYGTPATEGGLLYSDSLSNEVVEFGNVELNTEVVGPVPRLSLEGQRVFGLSRGGVDLPRYSSQALLNLETTGLVRPGAMAWVEGVGGGLRVWTGGSGWLDVGLV